MRDFQEAYKDRSVIEIGSKTVETDYERGRTESKFKPRRFGGTLGDSRATPEWLEKQLDKIREKYPELTEEKGEINGNIEEGEILVQDTKKNSLKHNSENGDKSEYIGRKKHRLQSRSKSRSDYRLKSSSPNKGKNSDKYKKSNKDTEMGEIV